MNSFANIILVVQLLLFVDLSSSDCGKETKEFMSCWYKARDKLHSKSVPFDKFESQISNCFTENGCKAVTLESEGYGDKNKDEKEEKCYNKLKQAVKKRADKCIQAALDKDFELPPFVATEPISYVQYPIAHEIYQMIFNTSICPEKSNITKLSDCINNEFEHVFSRRYCKSPFKIAVEFDNSMAQYCDAGCFKKLSSKCSKTLNETYSLVCSCVPSPESLPTSKDYSKDKDVLEYVKCAGNKNNFPESIFNSATIQLSAYYCETDPKDPCTESTLNVDDKKYKPIYFPIS